MLSEDGYPRIVGLTPAGLSVRVDDGTPLTNLYRSMLDPVRVATEKVGTAPGN